MAIMWLPSAPGPWMITIDKTKLKPGKRRVRLLARLIPSQGIGMGSKPIHVTTMLSPMTGTVSTKHGKKV